MGLRGVGANPIKRATDGEADVVDLFNQTRRPASPPAWLAPGLSRSDRVIAFIHSLTITAGSHAGRSFELRPWQIAIIREIYAEDATGRRPVRTAVLSFGRKNGKTALAAALALAHLSGPESEARGECYSAANDRNQASKIFHEMAAMVQAHPVLSRRISIKWFAKSLEDMENGSVFVALSSDAKTKMGLSPSFAIYDELGQSESRGLYDALDSAMGARDCPLFITISTQAATDQSPLSILIDYGLQVQAAAIDDPTFKLFLHAAPQDADLLDETAWRAANPALGDFLSLDEVRRQAAQAKRMPAKEPSFRNLILNQRVSGERHFVTAAEWMANAAVPDRSALAGRLCFAGLDLSAVKDLTALVLVFPDDDGAFDVLPFFWLPQDTLHEREAEDKAPYWTWRDKGLLHTTPGRTVDPAFIAAKVDALAREFDLQLLAFDRWKIDGFKRELADCGCETPMQPFGQGFKDMAPAVDYFERLLIERKLRHGAHPILTWNITNAVVSTDPTGARKLDKQRARGRIDGAVALTMALGAAAQAGATEQWSPFFEVVDFE
jgi:phage terminase large subunit-like protein